MDYRTTNFRTLLKTSLLLGFITCLTPLFAQHFNGNVASANNNLALHYGTVDIYRGEKLVSSVLTDSRGNFDVKLDTGAYRCEVRFAGCKPVIQEINVRESNVQKDFKLMGEPKVKVKAELNSEPMKLFAEDKVSFGKTEGFLTPPKPLALRTGSYRVSKDAYHAQEARSGVLTGGEVNDFTKIVFWTDLVSKEMNTYKTAWKFSPEGRYTVQLKDQNGLPLADAQVRLLNQQKLLFETRTDNSGQAELWASTTLDSALNELKLKIEVDYKGQKKTVRAKGFNQGLNHITLETVCEQSQDVDIAFVIDATGSMGDEIHFLKEELNEIIFQSKVINPSLNFRFANTFYRDFGEEYVVKQQNFTRILSESADFISNQFAAGGGDYEEAVDMALDSAITGLDWSKTARARILFLVLDAPPHNTERGRKKLDELMRKAAQQGIRIVPLAASGINKSTEYLMRCLALGTNGTYLYLSNHSGVGNPHIEPSADSLKVEKLSSLMTRVITNYVFMPDCEQNIPDLVLNYPDSVVLVPADTLSGPSDVAANDSLREPTRADSINENQMEAFEWSFYPNPNFGLLNIKANADIDELYLTDMNGKILQVIRNIQNGIVTRVDLSDYASGVYLLRYPKKDKLISGKIILVRNG